MYRLLSREKRGGLICANGAAKHLMTFYHSELFNFSLSSRAVSMYDGL